MQLGLGLYNTKLPLAIDSTVEAYEDRVIADGGTVENISGVNNIINSFKGNGLYPYLTSLMIPSGYKAGTLYSIIPTDGSGDFDVVRVGDGGRVDSDGLIDSVADNVPRIDYSSGDAVLLTEPSRINLFLNSDVGVTQDITVTSGVEYTFYFRSGAGSIALTDATTQTVTVSDAVFNNAVTFTTSSTTLTCTVTGVANQVQCELGDYPNSYIPTTASPVTRALDDITDAVYSGTSESGVLMVKVAALANSGGGRYLSVSDGISQRIRFYYRSNANQFTIQLYTTSSQYLYTITGLDVLNPHDIALRWAALNFSTWVDGVKVDEQLSGATFSTNRLNKINFAKETGAEFFYGKTEIAATFQYLDDDKMALARI